MEKPTNVIWRPQPGPQSALVKCAIPLVFFGGARGGGKALSVNELVPVPLSTDPTGWKRHGDLIPGDEVFHPSGLPVVVEAVYDRGLREHSFEVCFDTGEVIVADGEHLWHTFSKHDRVQRLRMTEEWRARRRASRPSRAVEHSSKPWVSENLTSRNKQRQYIIKVPVGGVRSTVEIAETLTIQEGRELNHSIPLTMPVAGGGELPIEPYFFGLWLGDGNSSAGRIGMAADDLMEIEDFIPCPRYVEIERRYQTPFHYWSFAGLASTLRRMGVLGAKRIPAEYLRAAIADRIALLQGMMDTDGYCDARGQCEIGLSDPLLIADVYDLLSGLGIKTTIREHPIAGAKTSYRCKFLASFPVFRLSRKRSRQKLDKFRPTVSNRYIMAITPCAPAAMNCIKVSTEDGLYLVTRSYITTHNTDGVLGRWAIKAGHYGPGFNAVLFRRELPMLDDAIARSHEIYTPLGGRWNDQKKTWLFPNRARIRFRPLLRLSDADKYQGQNISDICIEEAGQYPDPSPIDRLFGALRSAAGVPTQMILTGNPGGAGQFWLKERHIDPCPSGMQIMQRQVTPTQVIKWVFIPSRIQNNQILMRRDPDYISRLQLVGSPKLVQAWLDGDFSAVEGAFFEEWDSSRHVIEPFPIPPHWTRFMGFDWGSAAPFAALWFAVSDGTVGNLPKDALVGYREWYGAKLESGRYVGLKMTTEEVARGIVSQQPEKLNYAVADPAIFAADGGPSRAEIFLQNGVVFHRADNRRVAGIGHLGGWDEVRNRLRGIAGKPLLYFFETCRHTIRTLPVMQHDAMKPEDLDTDSEDHLVDVTRYSCMSRPWTKVEKKKEERSGWRFDDLLNENIRRLRGE